MSITPQGDHAPDTVYHYTNGWGIQGIIASQKLHATHIRHMNDSEEAQHAFTRAAYLLNRALGAGVLEDVRKGVEHATGSFSTWLQVNFCIVSFSEAADSLSQWRGYGGADQGYAIGFNRQALANIGGSWRFGPCLYEQDVVDAEIMRIIARQIQRVRAGELDEYGEYERVFRALYSELVLLAPFVKNAAFHEEKEWRLVGGPFNGGPDGPMRTRVGRRGLIPYTTVDIPVSDESLCVDEVWLGPGGGKAAEHALDSLLFQSKMLKKMRPKVSKAPYLP